jgi:hypothetical protein
MSFYDKRKDDFTIMTHDMSNMDIKRKEWYMEEQDPN